MLLKRCNISKGSVVDFTTIRSNFFWAGYSKLQFLGKKLSFSLFVLSLLHILTLSCVLGPGLEPATPGTPMQHSPTILRLPSIETAKFPSIYFLSHFSQLKQGNLLLKVVNITSSEFQLIYFLNFQLKSRKFIAESRKHQKPFEFQFMIQI